MKFNESQLEELIFHCGEYVVELESDTAIKCAPETMERPGLRKLLYRDVSGYGKKPDWLDVSNNGIWIETNNLIEIEAEDENKLKHGKFVRELDWIYKDFSIKLLEFENILQVVFSWGDEIDAFYKKPVLFGSIKYLIETFRIDEFQDYLILLEKIEDME